VRATADTLRRLISAIVKKGGSAAEEADLVAEHLVRANLMGHDSHGVGMIPTYVRHLKMGLVVPNTGAKVVKDDGALLMFDGGRGYGRPVAGQAMDAAIARCRESGVVAMGLANAHHIGRVGAYGEMASAAGLVSMHFVNVTDHRATVAPFRGTDARFVTNRSASPCRGRTATRRCCSTWPRARSPWARSASRRTKGSPRRKGRSSTPRDGRRATRTSCTPSRTARWCRSAGTRAMPSQ